MSNSQVKIITQNVAEEPEKKGSEAASEDTKMSEVVRYKFN